MFLQRRGILRYIPSARGGQGRCAKKMAGGFRNVAPVKDSKYKESFVERSGQKAGVKPNAHLRTPNPKTEYKAEKGPQPGPRSGR